MTGAADVRGFYAAIEIELPSLARENTTVRCFADPEAHAHADRTPSCSVSLEHGAWRCWACGARGGAYDAALARGHTPTSAFALLVEHGLADHEETAIGSRAQRIRRPSRRPPAGERAAAPPALAADEFDVRRWNRALLHDHDRLGRRVGQRRPLWSPKVIAELALGHDGERITIPIRDELDRLQGVLRYRPGASPSKMLAVAGTRLGLIPHPAREVSPRVLLVEGPPDMIAARSAGWPAIAVPGDHAWRPEWARLLRGRAVTVVMDSDPAGRAAAERIAADLRPVARVRLIDLAPERGDGYDLTDWLLDHPRQRSTRCRASSSPRPTISR